MGSLGDGEFRRWRVEMRSSGDGEFTGLGVYEMGSSGDRGLRDG